MFFLKSTTKKTLLKIYPDFHSFIKVPLQKTYSEVLPAEPQQ